MWTIVDSQKRSVLHQMKSNKLAGSRDEIQHGELVLAVADFLMTHQICLYKETGNRREKGIHQKIHLFRLDFQQFSLSRNCSQRFLVSSLIS